MPYGVVVIGDARAAVTTSVTELVGEGAVRSENRRVVVTLPDQSALLAVMTRLHELGIEIDHVYRQPRESTTSPETGGAPGRSRH